MDKKPMIQGKSLTRQWIISALTLCCLLLALAAGVQFGVQQLHQVETVYPTANLGYITHAHAGSLLTAQQDIVQQVIAGAWLVCIVLAGAVLFICWRLLRPLRLGLKYLERKIEAFEHDQRAPDPPPVVATEIRQISAALDRMLPTRAERAPKTPLFLGGAPAFGGQQ